jgi:hypothetical protein
MLRVIGIAATVALLLAVPVLIWQGNAALGLAMGIVALGSVVSLVASTGKKRL